MTSLALMVKIRTHESTKFMPAEAPGPVVGFAVGDLNVSWLNGHSRWVPKKDRPPVFTLLEVKDI